MYGHAGYIDDVRPDGARKETRMDIQHYFDLLREIRDTSMATVARDGTPRIRIIDTMFTKDHKLYFLTARGKDFYRELMRTGQVAVTGLNERWETVRLQGKVRNIGHEYLDEIFEKNPSMNSVYPGDSREILEVFCLYEGQGEYFCLADHPIVRKSFCFGNVRLQQKGFIIGSDCIGCGTCVSVCPQGAVVEGSPFQIRQENCLHCGRCFENCPVQAIAHADGGIR